MSKIKIIQLTKEKFNAAVDIVLKAKLDTKEEVEHHLQHLNAHYVAITNNKVVGVIGWYQDTVNYASKAMGDKFPGIKAYWVGFFAVDEKYQKQGIGNILLQKIESIIKTKNIHELWVSSVPETKSYYEEHGFKVFSEGDISGNHKFFLLKHL